MHVYTVVLLLCVCKQQVTSAFRHSNSEGGVTEGELKERLLQLYDPSDVFYQFPPFAEGSTLVLTASENDAVSGPSQSNGISSRRYGNTCPGYFINNTNTNRVPPVIAEWKCSCQRCQLPPGSMPYFARRRYTCNPIHQLYPTLHTIDRTSPTAEWTYRLEPISVGCQCEDYRSISSLVSG